MFEILGVLCGVWVGEKCKKGLRENGLVLFSILMIALFSTPITGAFKRQDISLWLLGGTVIGTAIGARQLEDQKFAKKRLESFERQQAVVALKANRRKTYQEKVFGKRTDTKSKGGA